MSWIGRTVRPLDWEQKTNGSFRYGSDLAFPGMLIGRILRSPYSYARLVSVDVDAARKMAGVHAIITAADLPNGRFYKHEGAADRTPLATDFVRFIGQEVAAVAADSAAEADAALTAIKVDYQRLEAPLNVKAALRPSALRMHRRAEGLGPNVSRQFLRQWGDFDRGRKASDVSVKGSFVTPPQTHACLETNVTLAQWDDRAQLLHLWTATQSPIFVSGEVAHVLGLEPAQVICHEVGVGGGFGGKSKICEQEAIAGELARRSGRPVRIAFSREEEFETTKTRHGFYIDLRMHADLHGHMKALDGSVQVDNGAYNHTGVSVMGAGVKALGSLYQPDGLEITARLVDTAKQPGGSFRGYGSSQCVFALESLMDELAERLDEDPLELRLKNANRPFETKLVGSRVQSARLVECLEAVRENIDWDAKKADRQPGRGLGVGVAMHVSGSYGYVGGNKNGGAIDILANGRVRVRFGGADCGTGQKTILAQIAAEELGVDVEQIDVLSMESAETPYDQGAWGSRGTYFSGHSTRLAAKKAAEALQALAALHLGNEPVALANGMAVAGPRALPLGDLAMMSPDARDGTLSFEAMFVENDVEMADPVTGVGNLSGTYSFAAHAAEVRVDRRTGDLRISDYVAAHDIGTVINPILAEGQAVGGTVMGIGGALREELVYEQGKLVNAALIHYALPRAGDVPRIRNIFVPGDDPKAPYGAKGVGELGHTPVAPALANAIYDAVGVRIRDLPITPDKIISALAQKEGRTRGHQLWRRPDRWWIALIRWLYPRGLFKLLHRPKMRLASAAQPGPRAGLATPATIEAALDALTPDTTPVAGATDLLPRRRQGLTAPRDLISLLDIASLQTIERTADSIEIGAAVPLSQLLAFTSDQIPVVSEAIDTIASPQIRAMATLGGDLIQAKRCWFYRNGFNCYKRSGALAPCYAIGGDHRFHHAVIGGHRCQAVTPSDMATVLMALDATAHLATPRRRRTLSFDQFYTGPGEVSLQDDEILTHVQIPLSALERRGAFEKLRLCEGDFAIASVAMIASIDAAGIWHHVRLVFGGLAPTPWRARRTEAALSGTAVTLAQLRTCLDRELDGAAHPLAHNGWKLDAAAGLAETAFERITRQATGDRFSPSRHVPDEAVLS